MINNLDINNWFKWFVEDLNKDRKTLTSRLNILDIRLRDIIPNMSRNIYVRTHSCSLEPNGYILIQLDICYILDGVNYCSTLGKKYKVDKFTRKLKLKKISN